MFSGWKCLKVFVGQNVLEQVTEDKHIPLANHKPHNDFSIGNQ